MSLRNEEYGVPDEENPEWTGEVFAKAVRLHELPEPRQGKLRAIVKQQKARKQNKVAISIRLSQDVVDELRASGAGWQARVDEALRNWLRQDSKGLGR